MGRIVSTIVGLIGATLLFWVGIAYVVYLPAGWPNYKVALWTVHAPWAGAVQAEHAKRVWVEAQWSQCRTNEATLRSAIASQNAAVDRLAALGLRATAEAESAVSASRSAFQRASAARVSISAPLPVGDGSCEAAKVVDGRLLGSLR